MIATTRPRSTRIVTPLRTGLRPYENVTESTSTRVSDTRSFCEREGSEFYHFAPGRPPYNRCDGTGRYPRDDAAIAAGRRRSADQREPRLRARRRLRGGARGRPQRRRRAPARG